MHQMHVRHVSPINHSRSEIFSNFKILITISQLTSRANPLAFINCPKVIAISTATIIVERRAHAPLNVVIIAPLRLTAPPLTRIDRQRAHRSILILVANNNNCCWTFLVVRQRFGMVDGVRTNAVDAFARTIGLRFEAIRISHTAAIVELLAATRCAVKMPASQRQRT